ncbi:RagB/SusD family nutrient uptake outer membrane protein [Chitinophaga ginsengisoli]|uniref:SusD-like starch-binding protein associating with outer membrane n=1 Tax=Chitinophaga ginsengisoli TaxID=363837 RepID=A0A2P8G6Z4_9BACT|nr:RagB/SusD family nutrient uptake outer membrane protein [Chitinophaga ginsengisoli]PSL29744.1 SusD-like starch-binding protein associating with outer membrane [Chitinophaga ginsengisoli]
MQRKALYILFTILPAFAGCEKYLDQAPDSTWTQLDTPEKVSQLLGTAYPQANYMTFCEAMSDNVSDKGTGVDQRTNRDPFYFNDVQNTNEDSPEYYWQAAYKAIAAANNALIACENAKDTAAYSRQKGEALVARAYSHFMLVSLFSKTFDAATANIDMGIPYVTQPEEVVFRQYDRKTVAYVYEQIEKDLLAGLPLIRDDKYKVPSYHFTQKAAYAFAARFYLYKRDYSKVVMYADMAFPTSQTGAYLRPWNTSYVYMSPLELFNIYTNSSEKANLLLVETASSYGRYVGQYRFGMNYPMYYEILGRGNVTGGGWCFPVYTYSTNDYFVPKVSEYFVKQSVNANIGFIYTMVPLFTAEEVLFNRVEANANLGNTAAALADLNLYASTRITNYNPSAHNITLAKSKTYYGVTDDREALLSVLFDFKRAEFVQEGLRWFDLMRYKVPVTHVTRDGETLVLGADDPRRVFQLPVTAKTSGLPMNPR